MPTTTTTVRLAGLDVPVYRITGEPRPSALVGVCDGEHGRCLVGHVVDVDGSKLRYSRYPDEDRWLCDAFYRPSGFPVYEHGVGSRCCAKDPAGVLVARELDELAGILVERGIWEWA